MGTIDKKSRELLIKRLCEAIITESIEKGCDFWDDSWNQDYTIDISLSVEEIKVAARIINYKPQEPEDV